ncbi:hypothetical protein [Parafrankia elaeagni]|uniref:hypothetical protein n=1 Tax=Parafrankia elaeagni TaxID=222534 RepID=UPI00036491CD|nr:hypothetical protein [Parafrankia elaeagni]
MTSPAPLVPVALRPIALIARMAALPKITSEEIGRMLATFTPPIDPASPEWAALRAALNLYDTAQAQADVDAARTQVNIAAVALLAGTTGHAPPGRPTWCRVPAQRTPPEQRHTR